MTNTSYRTLLESGQVDFSSDHFMAQINAVRLARSDLSYDTAPIILLGSGSVLAEKFVAYALAHFNVIASVDNARAGQMHNGLTYIGDPELRALLDRTPDAIGILCCGSEAPIVHFRTVWGNGPQPLVSYFEVLTYLPHDFDPGDRLCLDKGFSDPALIADIHHLGRTLFTDAESRRVLDAVLMYRISWDLDILPMVARPARAIYFDNDLCALGPNETFIDGGAYDGDTTRDFAAKTHSAYRAVHAFEFDPLNVAAFKIKTGALPNVHLHEAGLWSRADRLGINLTGGMGSCLDASSDVHVPMLALDDLNLGPVSFIKLDIEGAEVPALEGMRKTIAAYKPKLALSAYHKPDDLPRIAGLLRDIHPDYKFELRHYSSMIWDMVLYAA